MIPLTADGVPFEIGMPLVFDCGREVDTSGLVIEWWPSPDKPGEFIALIGTPSSGMRTDIKMFYSSHRARLAAKLDRLIGERRGMDLKIANVEAEIRRLK